MQLERDGEGQAESERRRLPSQKRSRERVERMLEAASGLIARNGSDALKMSEIAARAAVPIGSLYQFFPDKSAIIRVLAERYTRESQICIAQALATVRTREDMERAFADLVDAYYGLVLAEPVMRDIWSGTQADRALRELELADSRASAKLVTDALMRVGPDRRRDETERTAFLMWQLGEAAVRLAISVGRDDGDAMIAAYKRMALRELLECGEG
jgi:AcrR family transcriptional regulator